MSNIVAKAILLTVASLFAAFVSALLAASGGLDHFWLWGALSGVGFFVLAWLITLEPSDD